MSTQPFDDALGYALVLTLVESHSLAPLTGDEDDRKAAAALHQRLRPSHPDIEVEATLSELTISASSPALGALLSWLRGVVAEMQHDHDPDGPIPLATWSAGLSWGQLRSFRAADGLHHRVGVPIDDARLLSRRAAAGAILASGAATMHLRDEGDRDVGFGSRLYVRGNQVGTVTECFELTIGDSPARGTRRGAGPDRARGTVQRWSADRPYGFLVDDHDQFFYFDDRHAVGHGPPTVGQTVFFLPRPPLQPGRNPLAAAVLGDNDVVQGVVLPRAIASPNFVRVADKAGYHQDLHVHGPTASKGLTEGQEVRLRVMVEPRGPVAADVRPIWSSEPRAVPLASEASDATVAVAERFPNALIAHLREKGAHAAGAAVRRATSSHRSGRSESPRVRRKRVLALADHALRVWARRGLEFLEADASLAGLDSLGRVRDEDDAGYAAIQLANYAQRGADATAAWDEDLAPVFRSIRKALEHAGKMPRDWENSEAATEASLATEWAGRALAEAFLAGIVTTVALEAAAVVRLLEGLR